MTSLQTNGSNQAATAVTTANKLAPTIGGTETSNTTAVTAGTTGWIALFSQGTATQQTGAGSEPTISDSNMVGWFLDDATLDNTTMASGNHTPTVILQRSSSTGTFTADIHCVIVRRPSGGGTYTVIADIVLSTQTINSIKTTYSLPATSGSQTVFNTGDRFGYIFLLNITTNTTIVSNTIAVFMSTSASTGVTNDAQDVTPGFTVNACLSTNKGVLNYAVSSIQYVLLTNCGSSSESWTVTILGGSSWITVTPNSGSLGVGASQTVGITVNVTGLSPGLHTDTVQFSSGGATANVVINLQIPSVFGYVNQSAMASQGLGIMIGNF